MTNPQPTFRNPFARRFSSMTVLVLLGGVLVAATTVSAAGTPEQACQKGRYDAAAKYRACEAKGRAKYAAKLGTPGALGKHRAVLGKCFTKYVGVWPKLQAKAAGSGATCDGGRFVDNGNGTVSDRLTGLVWEKKTTLDSVLNPSDPHDADNFYKWSLGGAAADGDLFTDFFAQLNGLCFAGDCDWRLPTAEELQTILLAPEPCGSDPCIDPIFGPTASSSYRTATPLAYEQSSALAEVHFDDGLLGGGSKTDVRYVRAVRSGL